MHDDFLQTTLFCELEHCFDVRDVAVDTAVGQQTENMERAAGLFDMPHRVIQRKIIEKNLVLDGFGDAGKFLVDDASGADIEVPDFGVSHLPFGKSDSETARRELDVRIFGEDRVQIRCPGGGNGVSVRGRIETEAVQYHQHGWSFVVHKVCLLSVFCMEIARGCRLTARFLARARESSRKPRHENLSSIF